MSDKSRIWDVFIEDTYPLVRQLDPPRIPAESDYYAVIVEPRRHPHLEYVLRNVMHFLGPGWGLQIYASKTNYTYATDIVNGWGAVYMHELNVTDLDLASYNHFKKSRRFWSSVKGKHQLCFEVDSLLRRREVGAYLEYDYIGAPWREDLSVAKDIRVGNSGMSLRQRWAMLDVIENCNTQPGVIPLEDVFFSVHLSRRPDRYKMPGFDIAKRFSVESVFEPDPVAIHKPWEYLSNEEVRSLLETIDYGTPV